MAKSEADPSAKASAGKEQPPVTSIRPGPATPIYPNWPTFQAYSPIPPPGFFLSAMTSSPSSHPYVWGAQHLLPPYGLPPYFMYPHGGIYAHPSMAPRVTGFEHGSRPFSPAMASHSGNGETSGAVPGGREAKSKPSEGKEKCPIKKSKISLCCLKKILRKNAGFGKTSGASGNEAYSQSGESESEASSEGSDANSQTGSPPTTGDHRSSFDAGTSHNGNHARTNTGQGSQKGIICAPSQPVLDHTMSIIPAPVPAVSFASPTTSLNVEKGVWSAKIPTPELPIRGKILSTAVPTTLVPGALSELWIQDERELKRQRRKQSNRESARRSRLRKQAECEELARCVEVFCTENASLTAEINRLKKDYELLLTQNTSLKESLEEILKGIEELIHDKNEKSSTDDDPRRNLESDEKGKDISMGNEELIHDKNENSSSDDDPQRNLEFDEKGKNVSMGTEELMHDKNEKFSAEDDHQQNLESDGKGKENPKGTEEPIPDKNEKSSADDDRQQNLESDEKRKETD